MYGKHMVVCSANLGSTPPSLVVIDVEIYWISFASIKRRKNEVGKFILQVTCLLRVGNKPGAFMQCNRRISKEFDKKLAVRNSKAVTTGLDLFVLLHATHLVPPFQKVSSYLSLPRIYGRQAIHYLLRFRANIIGNIVVFD